MLAADAPRLVVVVNGELTIVREDRDAVEGGHPDTAPYFTALPTLPRPLSLHRLVTTLVVVPGPVNESVLLLMGPHYLAVTGPISCRANFRYFVRRGNQ
jgi:hypothetical protein